MVVECLLFAGGAKVVKDAGQIEYLKSKQLELTNEEKEEILEDDSRRFIHFTSKENAKSIISSGFFVPTKGVLNNHFTKTIDEKGKKRNSEMVYMFDNKTFSVDDYIRNLPKKRSPYNGVYEYYAVSTKPDKYALNSFKKRAQDGAITYDGRLDIDGTDTKLTKYVLGLDEDGKYTFNEMGLDEEYIPSDELLQKLKEDKSRRAFYGMRNYISELKQSKTSMKRFKVEKEEYKRQIKAKREFAKANKQYIKEEKEKSYIYKKDGRTIVVKNLSHELVNGKTLNKIAIMESMGGRESVEDATKLAYMDEFNLENIDSTVAGEYFFNNIDNLSKGNVEFPEYIGLPLENLENGTVQNDYDEEFRQSYLKKVKSKEYADKNIKEYNKGKFSEKLKSFFGKIFNKNKAKMLDIPKTEIEIDEENAKRKLNELGYSSVEAMNKDDKSIIILDNLENMTYTDNEFRDNIVNLEEKRHEKEMAAFEKDVI